MDIKQVSLVYFSPTGGTRKMVQAVGTGTGLPIGEIDFTILRNAPTAPAFGADELVVIGLPIYVGRIPVVALPYLDTLKGDNTPCILIGTYGNRHYDDMLVELEDLVAARGFVPVGAAAFTAKHSFSDELGAGRPNDSDLTQAGLLGKQVLAKLLAADAPEPLPPGRIPGGRPYRPLFSGDKPREVFAPVVKSHCTSCGQCVQACPSGAIQAGNPPTVEADPCIRCRACARVCPVGAIEMEHPTFLEQTAFLLQTFGGNSPEPVVVV